MRGKAGRFSRLAPFDLLSLPGLTGWWDASDSSRLFDATSGGSAVAADGQVARLEDKSGNSRHFTQGTSGSRPIRKTSIQNGLDVIRFSSDVLVADGTFSYADIQSAAASAFFAVAKAATVTTNGAAFNNEALFSEDSVVHAAFVLASDDTVTALGYDSAYRTTSVSYVPGSWIVFSSWHDGTSIHAKVNTGSSVSSSLGTRTFTTATPRLGANFSSAAYFDGDLGEVVTFDVALSESDRSNVISYLMAKWGIT